MKSLPNFILVGHAELRDIRFTAIAILHRFTLRFVFPNIAFFLLNLLPRAISTITSPVFCEFALELGGLPSHFNLSPSEHWGDWGEIDKLLEEQFARLGNFRLVIRTGKLYDRETFQRHAKVIFPLLTSRGCIHFETSPSVDKFWR